ncbi:MAG: M1 family aminopeptidase [Bacteroides sp.]|nr:M1 family aminopeptidase [Bacteroides sp.]
MNIIKTILTTCTLSGLLACGAVKQGEADLAVAGVSHELAKFRKEHFADVRYRLYFSIPETKEEAVQGREEVTLRMEQVQPLILDFRGSPEQVKTVSLNGREVPYEVKDEHIVIVAEHVKAGENRVEIGFTPDDQSLNRRDEFLYTLLVPARAHTVFPCFDQPDMKALFTLTLEVPSAWQAVANGAITEVDSTSVPGRNRISFQETEPLSTYLFSFVAGKLKREVYTRDGRSISIYHRETDPKKVAQCPDIATEVFDALEWQEAFTAVPYPFAKYDLIILPGFQFGGMEHTGATLYADRRMFLNENPTLDERLNRSALIAHETSHMWFGDFVTMEWFDDVWTKEVFANYFASRIVEPLYPAVNHRLNFMRDYIPGSYAEDRTAGTNPIKQELANLNDAGLVYGNIIYDKSPVLMEMLVRILGEDAFRQGIREYLTTYAYGNATWEGLIRILDAYTDRDLVAWSNTWVNEKGMPEISASVEGDELVVKQNDPLGRGLNWPQELRYRVISSAGTEDVTVSLEGGTDASRAKLHSRPVAPYVILPNTDGRGYGFFRIAESEAPAFWQMLSSSEDEVLRGSLLMTLYENLRHKTLSPQGFRAAVLNYLSAEQNSLLFSMALGYLGECQRVFPADARPVEQTLWTIVTTSSVPQHRLQAFRLYQSVADSEEAIRCLYDLWKAQKVPEGCALSENDYINLSYTLALYLPEQADDIVATQQARITNPDRKKEYAFIAPSVSPHKEVRDSVFNALLIAENRRVEPWASSALANLNHRLRQKEAVAYIRPALEALPEVQRTGDIFFPTSWVRALLSGHVSAEARAEVDAFFAAHPDFPLMLSCKVKQQAGHLY